MTPNILLDGFPPEINIYLPIKDDHWYFVLFALKYSDPPLATVVLTGATDYFYQLRNQNLSDPDFNGKTEEIYFGGIGVHPAPSGQIKDVTLYNKYTVNVATFASYSASKPNNYK